MINVNNKGKSFERDIARLLTKTTNHKWHRVPCSGALAQNRKDHTFHGDIYCDNDKLKTIHVECKAWKDLSITEPYSTKSKLHTTIQKTKKQSMGNPWVVIIKINNKGIFTVTESIELLTTLGLTGKDLYIQGKYVLRKVTTC